VGTAVELTEERANARSVTRVRVTRRAVFARDLSVWGFELMSAGGASAEASGAQSDEAQSDEAESGRSSLGGEMQLLNALAELGVKPLVADKTALITVTRDTLLGRLPLPASEATVLVLRLQSGDVDRELIEAADERMDDGFRLALSGELWSADAAPLLERATMIRIPFAQLALGVLDRIGPRPRAQQLWVDDVDQPEDFPNTRPYGPHFVSGDFLLKPSPVEGRRAPRNLQVLMELMTKLREPNVGFAEIESILRRDAGLSVTLLRFLNSAGFGLRVQVSNIRQAVALLGLSEFSKWVTLVGLGEAS
jgi:c-di-GMP-related signal transduction protein